MQADLVLRNGRIYTLDPAAPWAQSVACNRGRIVAAGSDDNVDAFAGPLTEIVDLDGRLVLPGLTDAHVHLLGYARHRHEVSLFGVNDLDEVRRRVSRAVAQAAPGSWVVGGGWDEGRWQAAPHRALLDDVAPDTPVVLKRMDLHSWWLNSAALRAAGIDRNTPDPPESQIGRDADGQPNGLLREWNAIALAERHLPDPPEETLVEWLEEAIGAAQQFGLTGVHDQRVLGEGATSARLLQRLLEAGRLRLRVHMNIAAENLAGAARLGLASGFGNDRLWLGHVKAFADGSMGSGTALMLEPYRNSKDNYGIEVMSPQVLRALAVEAQRAGFRLSVHAIGDRAVRQVIDALAQAQAEQPLTDAPGGQQHRIEHVQLIDPLDMPRLAAQRLVASMQPVHLLSDWPTADRVWGQRARHTYAFRSLLQHGATLAFGSDAPVAPINPFLGIYAAVTRQDEAGQPSGGWHPEERIRVEEAVRGYTMGAAVAAGKQHLSGSITPGKWADLIVLSQDIFLVPPAEIRHTQVLMSVFDGRVVFCRL